MVRGGAVIRTPTAPTGPPGPLHPAVPARARGTGMLARVLVTNHVLAGAVLAAAGPLARRPAAAFAVGVASHLALDVVPHWGDQDREVFLRVAVADGLSGLAAMAVVVASTPRARRWAVLGGMVGGAFPDLDKPSTLFFGRSPFPAAVDAFHARIQRESTARMPQEFVVGAVLAACVIALLRR